MYLNKAAGLLSLVPAALAAYNVRPFKIDLSSRVSHMNDLIGRTKLPSQSYGPGVDLIWLKDRQSQWLKDFNWKQEEAALNKFNHSLVDIGNMTVHFIHQRSSDPNAIPLLLTHGWPGSFYEFSQVITPLSKPGKDSNVSFHVVVPSLPGFGFSSPGPDGWNLNGTASLFDTLLTDVLGYKSYVAVGGDWGCVVTWGIHNNHANNARAVLYTGLLPSVPTLDSLLNDPQFSNQTAALSQEEKDRLSRNSVFQTTGNGYFIEQSTRASPSYSDPATIGLAVYDNPIGQLAWIGEKFLEWSDPQYGVPPSTITNNTMLTAISIYYLTQTFETAANTYYQNSNALTSLMRRAATNIPMGFAGYKFDASYYPEFYVSQVGNLVYYTDHPRGGHFSALDNPVAYVADIRTMMGKWYRV
ncbi:alpha/beta-hydrolase [Ceratobasidium sp. AG-I]|nr:alpha/beta-hydrolase [Ceratobasidium sp. AG-I]